MGDEAQEPKQRGKVEAFLRAYILWAAALAAVVAVLATGNTSSFLRGKASATDVPKQVQRLVEWTVRHDSLVTDPGLARIQALEDWRVILEPRVDEMAGWVYRIYCKDFPEDCDPVIRSRLP